VFETSGAAAGAFAALLKPSPPHRAVGLSDGGVRVDQVQVYRDRLATIQALRRVLAAVEAESRLALHDTSAGVSADLGHELPHRGDRIARPAERRWCGDLLVSVQDEVALSMDVSPRTAATWLNRSHDLVVRFPALMTAMRTGRVPAHAAWQIVQVLRHLALAESADAVVEVLLAWGDRYGWSRIRAKAREFAARAEPLIVDAWHEDGVDARHVTMTLLPDGMAQLEVVAPAVDLAAAFSAIANTVAGLIRDGDARTADQLRCDLVLQRLIGVPAGDVRAVAAPTVVIHATAADMWALADTVSGVCAAAPARRLRAVAAHGVRRRPADRAAPIPPHRSQSDVRFPRA